MRPASSWRLQLLVPGLEAEILVHDEQRVRCIGKAHGRHGLVERAAEGLLADGRQAPRHGLADQGKVGRRRGRDIDQVGADGVQHGGGVGEGLGDLEALGIGLRLASIGIADGDQLDLGDAVPGVMVKGAEIASTDGGDPELAHASVPTK